MDIHGLNLKFRKFAFSAAPQIQLGRLVRFSLGAPKAPHAGFFALLTVCRASAPTSQVFLSFFLAGGWQVLQCPPSFRGLPFALFVFPGLNGLVNQLMPISQTRWWIGRSAGELLTLSNPIGAQHVRLGYTWKLEATCLNARFVVCWGFFKYCQRLLFEQEPRT